MSIIISLPAGASPISPQTRAAASPSRRPAPTLSSLTTPLQTHVSCLTLMSHGPAGDALLNEVVKREVKYRVLNKRCDERNYCVYVV